MTFLCCRPLLQSSVTVPAQLSSDISGEWCPELPLAQLSNHMAHVKVLSGELCDPC